MMSTETGLYQHYKGGLYYLQTVATLEKSGDLVVVYRQLATGQRVWVRPWDEFFGAVWINGREERRFRRIDKVDDLDVELLDGTGS